MFQRLTDVRQIGFTGFVQRQPERACAPTYEIQGCFHRDGIHITEQGIAQSFQLQLQDPCSFEIVLQAELYHPVHPIGDDVSHHRDDADTAERADWNRFVIVSGPDVKIIWA